MNLTLLIDFNWLAISRLTVIKGFEKDKNESIKQQASEQFKDLIAKSISIMLNKFGCINNIILVSDMGSWRKQLKTPDSLKDIKYKGNREGFLDVIDWDFAYKTFNETIQEINEFGITTCKHINCEGDDWIWFWSKYLNSIGCNCMIWSADADLTQLVQTNQFGTFTCCYNDKKGLTLNKEKEDIEFFMTGYPDSPIKQDLISKCLKINYINPDEVIISKILMGDSSDNIKPVVQYTKNGRNYGFSKKDYEKLVNDLQITNIYQFKANTDAVIDYIANLKKFSKYKISKKSIRERMEYNEQLVWLSNDKIPESIKEALQTQDLKTPDISQIKTNYKVLLKEEEDIKNIFEGI